MSKSPTASWLCYCFSSTPLTLLHRDLCAISCGIMRPTGGRTRGGRRARGRGRGRGRGAQVEVPADSPLRDTPVEDSPTHSEETPGSIETSQGQTQQSSSRAERARRWAERAPPPPAQRRTRARLSVEESPPANTAPTPRQGWRAPDAGGESQGYTGQVEEQSTDATSGLVGK